MREQQLPIDIHYNKLLDWLINRRHCQQQWQGAALVIREKINSAIQDMPPVEEITTLLQGTYINYFHCQKIIELLKNTTDGSKNLFGMYSSQRMKDWLEILKLYEKDGVYLAEAAQLLMRNVNYEIPALKRQIAKCKQSQTDCNRKEGEYAANASELKEKFHSSCKQMGIEGKKVKTELSELAKDLPMTFDRIAANTKELGPACQYYSDFVSFTLGNEKLDAECVRLVRYMIDKGNSTIYEWKTGQKPSKVEEIKLEFRIEDEEAEEVAQTSDDINWGDDDIDFGSDSIDFGETETGEGGDIDWGSTGDGVTIELLDDSMGNVQVADEEGVAKGKEAMSLLDTTETRNGYIDELIELESFLTQRVNEMRGESSVISGSVFQNAPKSLQIDVSKVEDMLYQVQSILGQLTSKRMQDLLMIRGSPRYVNRIGESLKKILTDSEKMMASSRLMVTRRAESLQEERDTEPKLDLIRGRTKELKKQIETEVSKKYKDRPVNIMGEINTI